MAPYQFTCHQVALLLADEVTSNFNLEDQLLHVTTTQLHCSARQELCLIIRIQLGFQPKRRMIPSSMNVARRTIMISGINLS